MSDHWSMYHRTAGPTNRSRRLLAALFGAVALVLAAAAPAAAHAVVVASDPAEGQVLTDPPTRVTVQFSERVSAELGGLRVLDASGKQVDNADSSLTGTQETLTVSLPQDLPDGTYVASYRVISADGHAISGAFVFGIGEGTEIDETGVAGLTSTGDRGYEIAAAVTRFLTYAASLLAAGLAVFLAFVHDQRADRWRLASVVRAATLVAGLSTLATIAVQAALTTGLGIDAMTNLDTLRGALTEGLGWQSVVLLIGLAVVHISTDTSRLLVAQVLAFYGCLAIAVSFIFWGHSRQAPNAAISLVADALHVLTAAVWFGGLVGLGLLLRRRLRTGSEDPKLLGSTAAVVARFSTLAAVTLAALVGAGVVLAWQEIGSRAALGSTTYGRLVLAKVLTTLAVAAVAAYNRYRLLPEMRPGIEPEIESGVEPGMEPGMEPDEPPPSPAEWSRLSTTVRLEALGILVVLTLTSVLVYTTPPRDASATSPVVFNQTLPAGEYQANLVVTPAAVGANTLHVQYLDRSGRPVDTPRSLTIELELPDQGVGPLRLEAPRAGPGHFIVSDAEVPIAGTWDVTLVARLTDFDLQRTAFRVRIVR
jgi:copper transport protein